MPKNPFRKLSRRRKALTTRAPRPKWIHFSLVRTLLGFGSAVVLTVLMSIHFMPDRVSLNIGERSPFEVKAARSVSYIDSEATLRRQEDAASSVPNSYEADRTALAQSTRYVTDLFDTIKRIHSESSSPSQRLQTLTRELGDVFSQDQLQQLLAFPLPTLIRIEQTTGRLVETAMAKPIRGSTDDLKFALIGYEDQVRSEIGSSTEAGIVKAIGAHALRSNQTFNARRTRQNRDARAREVKPVTGEIRAGEVVLRQGEIFTQLHQDKATALGLISPTLDLPTAASIAGLASIMVIVIGLYTQRACKQVYNDNKRLCLLAAIILFSVLGLKLFGQVLGLPLSLIQFGYLGMMMVVGAGMMISVMLSARLAVVVTALLSMLTGLIMNHELRFTVMTLVSGLVGIHFVSNIKHRRDLLTAAAAVSAANLIMVWVLGGLLGDTIPEVLNGSAWAVLAACIGVGVFWFGVTMLEKPFGILTHAGLLELSSSEHPLLRELCTSAPGTYAHSVMVGNLAEAGAEAIGANSLFCRVAAYYHDVGKLRRPDFFVENQHAENVHNRLNPSLSALIIASHVRDGIELADLHKLPPQIKAIIAEHHGTSLIQYFYNQAVAGSADPSVPGRHDPVLEQHFRYEGPKPQTRESGIIMLADTIEAAVRCLNKPTTTRIQSRIEELVHQKMVDGQLDECDLTFRDIQQIQSAFARIMSGMLHGRIDYKTLPKPTPGLAAQGLSVELSESLTHALSNEEAHCAVTDAGHYSELTEPSHQHQAVTSIRTESTPQ